MKQWELNRCHGSSQDKDRVIDQNGETICEGVRWHADACENGPLLCAAPELLDICERFDASMTARWGGISHHTGHDLEATDTQIGHLKLWMDCQDAIAKAKGTP